MDGFGRVGGSKRGREGGRDKSESDRGERREKGGREGQGQEKGEGRKGERERKCVRKRKWGMKGWKEGRMDGRKNGWIEGRARVGRSGGIGLRWSEEGEGEGEGEIEGRRG